MPFNIATFRQYRSTANPNFSRFKTSSLAPLEAALAALPAGPIGPAAAAQIQALWAAVPHAKQTRYAGAAGYLRQFIPTLANAIPASPSMHYIEFKVLQADLHGNPHFPLRLYHVHQFRWQSSNGNMGSLATVGTRERVTHRTNPAAAPFDAVVNGGIPMTFTQGATTNTGANTGRNGDDHSVGNPSLILARPLTVGSVIADQVYEYTTDGATWHPIAGADYEIEKGVRMSGGNLVFYFRKQSAPPFANRFHFEVEYPIDPTLPVATGRIPVVPAGFTTAAEIRNYASRVIQLG